MTINTKFNVGDEVFTIEPKTLKIKKLKVDNINVWISNADTSTMLYDNSDGSVYPEDKCFPSKGELLNHITDEV